MKRAELTYPLTLRRIAAGDASKGLRNRRVTHASRLASLTPQHEGAYNAR